MLFDLLFDLQLFADEEVKPEVKTEEIKAPETTSTEVKETVEEKPAEEVKPVTEEKKEDKVPLATLLEERKKRQEAERQLSMDRAERKKAQMKAQLVERGYPEIEAANLADEKVRDEQEREEIKSKLLDIEIRDLATGDSFYSDAATWKDEIRTKMREVNCDAETAYMLVRGKIRTVEYRTQQEQLALAKRRDVEGKKVPNAAPTPTETPYKLDAADRAALEGLKKAMPDSGWTEKKYWELMEKYLRG